MRGRLGGFEALRLGGRSLGSAFLSNGLRRRGGWAAGYMGRATRWMELAAGALDD